VDTASAAVRKTYRNLMDTVLTPHGGVAVGTALTSGPPHGSRRAELPHRAPASGSGGEARWLLAAHDPAHWTRL